MGKMKEIAQEQEDSLKTLNELFVKFYKKEFEKQHIDQIVYGRAFIKEKHIPLSQIEYTGDYKPNPIKLTETPKETSDYIDSLQYSINSMYQIEIIKCECGADTTYGPENNLHSSWCQKHG